MRIGAVIDAYESLSLLILSLNADMLNAKFDIQGVSRKHDTTSGVSFSCVGNKNSLYELKKVKEKYFSL
jgi:hypothetical protein